MNTVDTAALIDRIAPSDEGTSTGSLRDMLMQGTPRTGSSGIDEQHARTVAAKLSLPHMGFILSRARLTALMEPVRNGGLVYLVAGPGYGKTALIVDRLSSAEGRTTYLSVDEGDKDPVRFLMYLMAGLGMEVREGTDVGPLDWSTAGGVDGKVMDLTARVVDFIGKNAGQRTLIAIDDFHLADSSPQVVNALEFIIRGLPPGWTVLISSRRPIPLGLDGVSLGGRLVEVRARELRLTPSEVSAWAAHNWNIGLHPSEARALWRLTQGWPAALVLLGQRLLSGHAAVTRQDIVGVIARGHDLRDYLEQDILSGLDSFSAYIMLTAGLLPRVTFPRDEPFFRGQPGQAETVLQDLVARGHLVARTGRRGYTVHPLVQGFAQRRALQEGDPTGSMIRAAEHLERIGEHHQAVSAYLSVGRSHDAARLVRSLFISSSSIASGAAREEWLSSIPHDAVGAAGVDPWLLVARARVLQERTDYAEAGVLYERAARLLAGRDDKEGLLPVLLGGLSSCLFNQGLWEECLAVLKRCRSLARSPREKAEVLVIEGGLLVSLCHWDEAVENWEKALALTPSGSRDALAQRIHFHRARLFYSLGHYRLAKPWAERAAGGGERSGSVGRTVALNGMAILAGLTGDYARAGRLSDECLRLVRTSGYSLVEAPSLLNQARVALGNCDYRTALARIREAQSLAERAGDAEDSFWAETMLGDLCRCNSNARRALEHHTRALDIVEKTRLAAFERMQAMAALGMDLVVLDREAEGLASLEEPVRTCRRLGLMGSLAPSLLYLGWLYARSGRERDAGRCLTESMRIAQEHEHVHFFSQEAKVAVPIFALCDRFGAGGFLRECIIPIIPVRLQSYFLELATGKIYPTDVSLGPPDRRPLGARQPVHAHQEHIPPAVVARIESLTDREREVLTMVGLGMPNKAIGAKLYISEKTVKTHTNHIFRKLGVGNRAQAMLAYQGYQMTGAPPSDHRRQKK